MIWNPQSECQAIEERKLLQLARLKNLVETLYSRVPFYRSKFDTAGVKPNDLKCLGDVAKFPFTVKDDLRETYPYGLLACPLPEIEEIHMSSGTTGVPVVDAYTRYDVECWEEGMARTLSGAGATRHDTVQNCYGYGLFTGRPRRSLRGQAHRRQYRPDVLGEYAEAADGDAGLRQHHPRLHALLRPLHGRGGQGDRLRPRNR